MMRGVEKSEAAKAVILAPVDAVKAIARGIGLLGRAVTAPFRLGNSANKKRKSAKAGRRARRAAKAERKASERFGRMAPRYQREVNRTRDRLFPKN